MHSIHFWDTLDSQRRLCHASGVCHDVTAPKQQIPPQFFWILKIVLNIRHFFVAKKLCPLTVSKNLAWSSIERKWRWDPREKKGDGPLNVTVIEHWVHSSTTKRQWATENILCIWIVDHPDHHHKNHPHHQKSVICQKILRACCLVDKGPDQYMITLQYPK